MKVAVEHFHASLDLDGKNQLLLHSATRNAGELVLTIRMILLLRCHEMQ